MAILEVKYGHSGGQMGPFWEVKWAIIADKDLPRGPYEAPGKPIWLHMALYGSIWPPWPCTPPGTPVRTHPWVGQLDARVEREGPGGRGALVVRDGGTGPWVPGSTGWGYWALGTRVVRDGGVPGTLAGSTGWGGYLGSTRVGSTGWGYLVVPW